MTNEALKQKLSGIHSSLGFDETAEWLTVMVEPIDWLTLAKALKFNEDLEFDFLFCLTCVDWKTHLMMVYHLRSISKQHTIIVKSKLGYENANIDSVVSIWKTAEFHEREVYELFGVNFLNHPDLRLLILPDGWEGRNPLRKNYEDEVNMIKL